MVKYLAIAVLFLIFPGIDCGATDKKEGARDWVETITDMLKGNTKDRTTIRHLGKKCSRSKFKKTKLCRSYLKQQQNLLAADISYENIDEKLESTATTPQAQSVHLLRNPNVVMIEHGKGVHRPKQKRLLRRKNKPRPTNSLTPSRKNKVVVIVPVRAHCGLDGRTMFNTSTHICCKGTVFRRINNDGRVMGCCNGSQYEKRLAVCCGIALYTKSEFKGENNTHGMCCDNLLLDSRCFKCANQRSITKFNKTTEMCCDGVLSKTSEHFLCLHGRETISKEERWRIEQRMWTDNGTNVNERNVELSEQTQVPPVGNNVHMTVIILSALGGGVVVGIFVGIVSGLLANVGKWRRIPSVETISSPPQNDIRHPPVPNNLPALRNGTEQSINLNKVTNSEQQDTLASYCTSIQIPTHVQLDTKLLQKTTNHSLTENCYENVFREMATQTHGSKPNNKRTVFGLPFSHSEILTGQKRTFEIPKSSVRLILPESLLAVNKRVEVHGFAPYSIPSIRRKFAFRDDEMLSSPTVEYCITGEPVFEDHAVIVMPIVGLIEDIHVWKFQSDEGASETCDRVRVPMEPDYTKEKDFFYMYVKGDNFIRIFTRGFSGYFCTNCKQRDLRMTADIYGSYRRTTMTQGEVKIAVYIRENRLKGFPQYQQEMEKNEANQKRYFLLARPLELLGRTGDGGPLLETDNLKLSIEIDDIEAKHKTMKNGKFYHQPEVVKDIKEVTCCHHENDSSYVKDWLLGVNSVTPPSTVNVTVQIACQRLDGLKVPNSLQTNVPVAITARECDDESTSSFYCDPENQKLRTYVADEFDEVERTSFLESLRKGSPHKEYFDVDQLLLKLEGGNSRETLHHIVVNALLDSNNEKHLIRLARMNIFTESVLPKRVKEKIDKAPQQESPGACKEPERVLCGYPCFVSPSDGVHAEFLHTPENSFDQRQPREVALPATAEPLLNQERSRDPPDEMVAMLQETDI